LTRSCNGTLRFVWTLLALAALALPGVGHAQSQVEGARRTPAVESAQTPASSNTRTDFSDHVTEKPDASGARNIRVFGLLRARDKSFAPVPPPRNLTYTNDAGACVAHGGRGSAEGIVGGLICKNLIPQGQLVLVWDYGESRALKGFRVYESVGGATERLVATQNPEVTLYLPDPKQSGGYAKACFRVTALMGNQESAPSAWFCGNQARLMQTMILTPSVMRGVDRGNDDFHPTQTLVDADVFWAGYIFDAWDEYGGHHYSNDFFRGAVLFDPAVLVGVQILSARLHLQVQDTCSTLGGNGDCVDYFTSCGARLFEGSSQDPWWGKRNWIATGNLITAPGVQTGPAIVFDVTDAVRRWAALSPNTGLVLAGDHETIIKGEFPGIPKCFTIYVPKSVTLEVNYYDGPAPRPVHDSVEGSLRRRSR
jgi:hypothetical protein